MAIQALRFTFADSDDAFDDLLRPLLSDVLAISLSDADVENRRLALSAFNACIQHKPELIVSILPSLMPLVIRSTRIDKSLIREVQMGPFRHKVDEGLELRKVWQSINRFS